MKTLVLNLLLVTLALALLILLLPLSPAFVGVELVRRKWRAERIRYLSEFTRWVAVALDMLGNVLLGPFWNACCVKQGGYLFGRPGQTISYVLGRNKLEGTLTDAGLVLGNFLDWLDPDHLEKAIISYYQKRYDTY